MSNKTPTTAQGKWADLLSGSNALLTIALTGGVALHAINIYIVTTILPSVVNDIGGLEYYAWNTTLFVATSIVGSALSSKILDSFGPK
ncbi:MFS transporter, partial [Salmonella enterica]|nr:MFS transporter [Salmonella enterica]